MTRLSRALSRAATGAGLELEDALALEDTTGEALDEVCAAADALRRRA